MDFRRGGLFSIGVNEVSCMESKRLLGRSWIVAAMGLLLAGPFLGLAYAGPEEDFAAGMVSYRRADFVTAMPALRKAADAGHSQAQAVLASILDAAESDEEAVAYYRKSAAAGNLDGIFGLGTMLANGEGVKKDAREAKNCIPVPRRAGTNRRLRRWHRFISTVNWTSLPKSATARRH